MRGRSFFRKSRKYLGVPPSLRQGAAHQTRNERAEWPPKGIRGWRQHLWTDQSGRRNAAIGRVIARARSTAAQGASAASGWWAAHLPNVLFAERRCRSTDRTMASRPERASCAGCGAEFERTRGAARAHCSHDCKRRSLIAAGQEDECWEWQGRLNAGGYGVFGHCRGERLAHRLAWIAEHGPIPDGLFILHECDNPRCCNPRHHRLGTKADNNADMFAKRRDALSRGSVIRVGNRFCSANKGGSDAALRDHDQGRRKQAAGRG